MQRTFGSRDVQQIFKFSREKYKELLRKEYLVPYKPSAGYGKAAEFSLVDVYALGLFEYLIGQCGMYREEAAKLSRWWRDEIYNESENLKNFIDLQSNYLLLVFTQEKKGRKILAGKTFTAFGKDEMEVYDNILSEVQGILYQYEGCGCDDFMVINFKKVRDRIDKAIAKLKPK